MALAAGHFNRCRVHLGETMNALHLDVSEVAFEILSKQDWARISKGEKEQQHPGVAQ